MSLTYRPVDDLNHREVLRISGRKESVSLERDGSNEAVRLPQRDAEGRILPAPFSCLPCGARVDVQHLQPREETPGRLVLAASQSPDDLLDVDRGGRRNVTSSVECFDPRDHGTSPQVVDEHRGVENVEHKSAGAARIGATLVADPRGRVHIPVVTLAGHRTRGGAKGVPSLLQLHGLLDGSTNEGTAAPRTGELVDLGDEDVVHLYVHSHV